MVLDEWRRNNLAQREESSSRGALLEGAQPLPLHVELGALGLQPLSGGCDLTLERACAPVAQQPAPDASRRQVDLGKEPLHRAERVGGNAHLPLDPQSLEPSLRYPSSALRSASISSGNLQLLDESRRVLDEHLRAEAYEAPRKE